MNLEKKNKFYHLQSVRGKKRPKNEIVLNEDLNSHRASITLEIDFL